MRTSELVLKVLVFHTFMMILVNELVAAEDDMEGEKITVDVALAMRRRRILKRQEFKRTKIEAAKYIKRAIVPGKLLIEGNFTSVIMEYDGEPMPLYIILIAMIPLLLAELCRLAWNLIRPKLKFQQEGGGEFPFTACYRLQESFKERALKRTTRNCISWFVHQYVLSAEDETLEWKDVINSLQAPPVRKRKPWHTIRLIFRLKNAMKRNKVKFEEKSVMSKHNLLDGNYGDAESDLNPHSAVINLNLDDQISQLELHYETLNAMEKDYEVPSQPHPQLFTVRELMEFMTRDEKLLVLNCFDQSQMNELMINCNIEEIRNKNPKYFNAYMDAAASVFDHVEEVEEIDSKQSADKVEPFAQASGDIKAPASLDKPDEAVKSLQTLFDLKDQLAKEIMVANDKLLEDWEKSHKQDMVKESILHMLDPIHVRSHKYDYDMEPEDIIDEFLIQEQPEELKGKPLTSQKRVEQIIKKAEYDIGDIEKRIEVKKKTRKKGKSKTTTLNMNARMKEAQAAAEKDDRKAENKTPFKWKRKSEDTDDIPEIIEILPKLKQAEVKNKNKDKKYKKKLSNPKNQDNSEGIEVGTKKRPSNDGTEEKHVNINVGKGRRNTAVNEAKEKEKQKIEPGEKNRRLSGNEPRELEKERNSVDDSKAKTPRRISGDNPKEKTPRRISEDDSKEKSPGRTSGDDSKEKTNRRISGDNPKDKTTRKTSGDDHKEKTPRRTSGDDSDEKTPQINFEDASKEKTPRITFEDAPEEKKKRRTSGDDPKEKVRRKTFGDDPKEKTPRRTSGDDSEEKTERITFEDAPKEKIQRITFKNDPKEKTPQTHFEDVPEETKKRRTSGEDPKEKTRRKTSGDGPKEETPIRTSGDDSEEQKPRITFEDAPEEKKNRRTSGDYPKEKTRRRTSGDGPKDKTPRRTSGDGPKEKTQRRTSRDDSEEKIPRIIFDAPEEKNNRRNSGDDPKENVPRRTSGDDPKEKSPRRISVDDPKEKTPRRTSGDDPKEKTPRRTSGDDPISGARKSFDRGGNRKLRKKPEEDDNRGQNMPALMTNLKEKGVEEKYPQDHDIHAVHDETVIDFLQKTDNKDITKSEVMAIERDTIFQESKHHPQIKIYSQGRRVHFEELKNEKLIKTNNDAPETTALGDGKISKAKKNRK